jgi:hypothetical protein
VTNSRVKWVKSVENQWTVAAFSTENILDASEDNSFGRMLIDRNGQNGWQQIEMVLLVLMKVIIPSKNDEY